MGTERGTRLVGSAMSGDPGARDQLVTAQLPLAYNIVGRAVNGHHGVDDAVRETMLRALDGLVRLRAPEDFRPWLVALAVDAARGLARDAALFDGAGGSAAPRPDFADLTMGRLHLSGEQREAAEAARWVDPDDGVPLALWWLECAGRLSRYEVAAALRWPVEDTAIRMEGVRSRFDAARVVVGALAENPCCPTLGYEAGTWDGRPSAPWREHLARHTGGCASCARRAEGLVPAEVLLAGLPLVPPPPALLAGLREAGGWGPTVAHAPGWGGAGGYGAPGRPETDSYATDATGVTYDPADMAATYSPADPADSADTTGTYDPADTVVAAEPYDPAGPWDAPASQGPRTIGVPAGPGPRGSRQARRHRRQERERSRRRAAVAAGIAVMAVTGGAFQLSTGRQGERETPEARRVAVPAPDLPVGQEPTSLSGTSPTSSASASLSAPPSTAASTGPAATSATTAATTSAAPSSAAASTPTKMAAPHTTPPGPRPTRTTAGSGTGTGTGAGNDADSGSGPGAGAGAQGGDSGAASVADQVIALVNEERAKAGCGPLTANATLTRAAQGHSGDMAVRDFFDHTNPDGDGPGERVTAAGYPWSTYGENIAKGQSTAEQVMDAWMNSPGHRANILNCSFEEIGIGVHSGGGPYWTQVFGAR